jgi:hypothetical protein
MADLTVTVTDTITTGGRKAGAERAHTISGINHVVQGLVTIPNAAFFDLLTFDSTARGIYQVADNTLKYLRVTNTDASNPVFLMTSNDAGSPPDKYINVEIPAGCSFTLFGDSIGGGSSFTSTLNKLYRLGIRATGGAADIEVFYATT